MLGSSQAIGVAISIIRNKFLAVLLGPSGVGTISQLVAVQNLLVGVSPLGLQLGTIRYIAKSKAEQSEESVAKVFGTSFKAVMILALTATMVCAVAVKPLARWTLSGESLAWMLMFPILSVPFALMFRLWITYLQALLEVKTSAKVTVVYSLVGLVALLPMVYWLRLNGAAIHLLIWGGLGALVGYRFAAQYMKAETRAAIWHGRIDFGILRLLSKYGAANVPPFALMLLTPVIVRAVIIARMGADANGIYQAAFGISNQYLIVASNVLIGYSYPKVSQLSSLGEINRETNNTVRGVLLFGVFGTAVLVMGAPVIVPLLYRADFKGAIGLLPLQMIGDLCRGLGWAVGISVLPREKFWHYLTAELSVGLLFLGLFLAVQPTMGLMAPVFAYALAYSLLPVVYFIFMRLSNGFGFSPENKRLLAASIALVCLVVFAPRHLWWYLPAGITSAVVWTLINISPSERRQVIQAAIKRVMRRQED